MFSGASNVKIFGGDFRQINGAYNHYEYKTTVSNHNSNNVTGNTLTETHNDNSQEFHGVNAKGRAYVRALRHASTQPQPGTAESPFNTSPQSFPTAEPALTPPEAEPVSVNLSAPFPTETVPRAPHSKAPYASYSIGPGDVRAMPPLAAAHFIAAFKHMDQDDIAEDTLPDILHPPRENPIHINENNNDGTASPMTGPPDDPELLADAPSKCASAYGRGPETSSYSSIPTSNAIAPSHQFRSQVPEPTSIYSNLAHNMRNAVTDAITRTHSDTQTMPATSQPAYPSPEPSTQTIESDGQPSSSVSHKSSHSLISGAGVDASYTTTSASISPTNSFLQRQTIYHGQYTEINHVNHTVNYPGSGNVSSNKIQTLYNTAGGNGQAKVNSDIEDISSLKTDERGQRRRQSKPYTGRRHRTGLRR